MSSSLLIGCRCIRRKSTIAIVGLILTTIIILQFMFIGYFTASISQIDLKNTFGDQFFNFEKSNKSQNDAPFNITEETSKEILDKLVLEKFSCEKFPNETLSAIRRAKSLKCKLEIANLSCLYTEHKLFKNNLPRYCNIPGTPQRGSVVGCFQLDSKYFKPPVDSLEYNSSKSSTSKCVLLCLQGGFTYAALKPHDCLCSKNLSAHVSKRGLDKCQKPCQHSENCEKDLAMVYNTGVKSTNITQEIYNRNNTSFKPRPRVAFLLTLNGRAVRHIKRLFKLIYRSQHYYYIHIDNRQEFLFESLQILKAFPNVRFANERFPTMWGGATLLTMILKCIGDLLQFKEWKWDFIINLSESDFPIKPIEELENYLGLNINKNFLKSHGYDTMKFIKKQGLDKTFHQCENHMWRVNNRKLPHGIVFDGGSDWIGINRNFSGYVTYAKDELLTGLKELYKYTLLPAESFFHTVLINSKFCQTQKKNNLRITNWRRSRGCKCQYKHIVDWCGCSPNDYTAKDAQLLKKMQNKPYFFARKFESIIDMEIVNTVQSSLGVTEYSDHPSYKLYWQSEYHHSEKCQDNCWSRLSTYLGFSRVSVRYLKYSTGNGHSDQSCSINPGKILEVFVHKKDNQFMGFSSIVQFESFVLNGDAKNVMILESQVIPRAKSSNFQYIDGVQRLKSVTVGTDYDVKENVFRNFAQVYGPYSKLGVKLEWYESKLSLPVTMVWLDPTGSVAISYDTTIKEKQKELYHKPSINTPLRPGQWSFKLIYKNQLAALQKFIVMPSSINSSLHAISDQKSAKSVNGGPLNYTKYDFEYVEAQWADINKKELKIKADINSKKHGRQLEEWIEELIINQYSVENICYYFKNLRETGKFLCSNIEVQPCRTAQWSSFYPDPKSDLSGLNSES